MSFEMQAQRSRKSHQNGQPESSKRAGLYVRVSSKGQEEEGTSLETQEARGREYAASRGDTVDEAHVYREVHTGVELWERPKLTLLREAIRQRAIDVLIVYAVDRLSRDPVHLGVILSEADHHDVAVEFVTEPLDDSPEGQLIRFVRGYAAKVEHEKIRERSIRGRRARVEAGKLIPVGRPLYGYQWNEDHSAYFINPSRRRWRNASSLWRCQVRPSGASA
jgi:site-specific DNA recombinase